MIDRQTEWSTDHQLTPVYPLKLCLTGYKYVFESDILGPNGNLSEIKNLVSLKGNDWKIPVVNIE